MEHLWAPWRMAYLQADRSSGPPRCFLCEVGALAQGDPADPAAPAGAHGAELVVWRGERVYALLNLFPYASGHVMVAPYAHEGELDRLDEAASLELMRGTRLAIRALRAVYRPQGFNVGANLGAAAGAGFGDHIHMHVVPRWQRDTNFMTTTGRTRVLPEDLAETAERLRVAWLDLASERE